MGPKGYTRYRTIQSTRWLFYPLRTTHFEVLYRFFRFVIRRAVSPIALTVLAVDPYQQWECVVVERAEGNERPSLAAVRIRREGGEVASVPEAAETGDLARQGLAADHAPSRALHA